MNNDTAVGGEGVPTSWKEGTRQNKIHLMYCPEGNSRENKTTWFPEGPYIKCFVIYLGFHIAKTKKQRQRAGNNCAIVFWSGYI